jgi:hypothetical protein
MTIRLPYCIIISLILIAGLIGNFFIWQSAVLGLTFGFAYLIFFSWILGSVLFGKRSSIFKFLYGLFFLISGISFLGALIYYFYQLNNFSITILIAAIPAILLPFSRRGNRIETEQDFNPVRIDPHLLRTTFFVAVFIFLTILNFRFLINAGITYAIRSPWEIIPFEFFLTYFGASAILLFFILKSQTESLNLILTSIHTFLTVSLVLFVYKIGYGFDPFIHQATEKIIAAQGFVLPKPFYYLGQYSLVVFLEKILQIPIEWIDKLLLPTLISLLLPATIFFSFKPLINRKTSFRHKFGEGGPSASLLSLLILILPFTIFINTTPQGLANFYLLIIIFLGILALHREFSIFYLWFLGLTTLLIHPLAGLPSLIFIFLLTLFLVFEKQEGVWEFLRQFIFIGSFVLSAVAVFLLFVAASFFLKNYAPIISPKFLEDSNNIFTILNWHWPVWINHFRPLYDLVYTYGKNIVFLILAIGLSGFFLLRKKMPEILVYLAAFFALMINYLLIKLFVSFPSLISYEQQAYSERILEISFYFLIPLFLFALYKLFEKLQANQRFLKLFFILLFPLFLTFSLYYSYPKDDGEDYQIDRGYNVSASDIAAVHAIDQDAGSADYIVLANQMVSAAAVREFGFAKYFGPYFYYPIPTGDPLYQYYLKMVYEPPTRATITEAADLTGVHLVYFVLNDYWTDADKITEAAKSTADNTTEIDNGKIWIFKYQF